MTFTTDYRKNKKLMTDFHRVAALAMRRWRVLSQRIFYGVFGVLGIGCGIVLLVAGIEIPIALLGLLVGAYFISRMLFYYQYLGFFSGRLMAERVDHVQYTFGDEGVEIDDALEHCVHPYHVFHGIYESRRIFLLLVTNRIGYIIAKSDLSAEQETALRAILKERFEVPLVYYDV